MPRARKPVEDYYWLLVTEDKYELPRAVAGTVGELAQITGAKKESIIQEMSRAKKTGYRCKWRKVPREEYKNLEEEENDRNM